MTSQPDPTKFAKKEPLPTMANHKVHRSSWIGEPQQLQLLKTKRIELEAQMFPYKTTFFVLSSNLPGKKYAAKEIHPNSFVLPELEKEGYKALIEINLKTGHSVYQTNVSRFKEFLKTAFTVYKEMEASLEKNKPKRNILIRMKEMFEDIRYDSSVVYLTGPAAKTGAFLIESKDFGEEELTLAEIVTEWKKRSSKQKHLLVILEANYSGKWVKELAAMKIPDVSVFAACREKEKILNSSFGGMFMHNFLKYLAKHQLENIIPVAATPVFGGNYLLCKKWTNFFLNFNSWGAMMTVQKSDFSEITYENGKYIGYMLDAQKNHWGMFGWTSGAFKDCRYYGEFVAGQLKGNGVMVYKNGRTYEGGFNQNAPDGYGEELFENGDSYKGKYKKGFKVGDGIYSYFNGDLYKGEFADNKPSGKGILTLKNGSVFEGNFKDGKCNGKGIFRYNNGDMYEGDWVNSLKHGDGKYNYDNGDVYEGQFVNGVRHGLGKLLISTGEIYNGEWAMDIKSGNGEYQTDHSKTTGEWVRGNLNKQPTFFSKLGSTQISGNLL